ncbi:MAG TPA: M23 family metallopeptidase [Bryobacteraceae bacterium]|jgi:murein DD-endopeptidase MepM/ murein hydrolase activator NlpD
MKQEYFVVVLAHSLHGRLRRIHVPHHAVYAILLLAVFGCFSVFGFVASYARMAWKVANYNALRREADSLRVRYRNLEKEVSQTHQQLASLELYAREVSMAYGIKQKLEGPSDISAEGKLVPTFAESLEDYNFLRSASTLSLQSRYAQRMWTVSTPSLWPVEGRLMGAFGRRSDPFSGEGTEFHTGIDISAPSGTPVRATADGIVVSSGWSGGYGRLVVIDHGGGTQTYYAHLSRFYVETGQEVRGGELVGAVGATGRVTAPHLHYEVRIGGAPVNPYRYLKSPTFQQASSTISNFLF